MQCNHNSIEHSLTHSLCKTNERTCLRCLKTTHTHSHVYVRSKTVSRVNCECFCTCMPVYFYWHSMLNVKYSSLFFATSIKKISNVNPRVSFISIAILSIQLMGKKTLKKNDHFDMQRILQAGYKQSASMIWLLSFFLSI